jgi:aromatic ring-cleaving dioxygenase
MAVEQPLARITGYRPRPLRSRDQAARGAMAEGDRAAVRLRLGRWRDEPIGPHPCGRYQIAFAPELSVS